MKTKNLSKEKALELIDYTKKIIEFNNKLNKDVRKFRRENNISRENFNGYWDEPTSQMLEFMRNELQGQDWMTPADKRTYLGGTGNIIGQVYSCAVNTYILKDLHDLEKHVEVLNNSELNNEVDTEFGFKVIRDTENTRLNLDFEGEIPSSEVRTLMKKNGFKWSPYMKVWTRQLTDAAEYSLKRLMQDLRSEIE